MASLRFLISSAFVCSLAACSVDPGGSTSPTSTPPDAGDKSGVAGSNSATQSGKAGHPASTRGGDQSPRMPVQGPDADDEGAGTPGEGKMAASPPTTEDMPPPESCDLNGTCVSKCEDTTVTCGIESHGLACELEGFTGATAQVSCGQRVVIGTACCGECGCVPVEVYFDGSYCWQGVPECKVDALANRMFFPHQTTTPNPSFTPPDMGPGSFYLGSGGFAGSGGAAGGLGFGGGLGFAGSGGFAGNAGNAGNAAAGSAAAGSAGIAGNASAGTAGTAETTGSSGEGGGAVTSGGEAGSSGAH